MWRLRWVNHRYLGGSGFFFVLDFRIFLLFETWYSYVFVHDVFQLFRTHERFAIGMQIAVSVTGNDDAGVNLTFPL